MPRSPKRAKTGDDFEFPIGASTPLCGAPHARSADLSKYKPLNIDPFSTEKLSPAQMADWKAPRARAHTGQSPEAFFVH